MSPRRPAGPRSDRSTCTTRTGTGRMADYSDLSAFASCPAATGASGLTPWDQFPDGAHRCGQNGTHPRAMTVPDTADRVAHRCTCGYVWTSLTGTLPAPIASIRAAAPPGPASWAQRG